VETSTKRGLVRFEIKGRIWQARFSGMSSCFMLVVIMVFAANAAHRIKTANGLLQKSMTEKRITNGDAGIKGR